MEFENLKRQILEKNCRSNSLEHALRLIENENKKVLVELGTIRSFENKNSGNAHSHEGYSTVLLSKLSMMKNKKFYSVDILIECINISKSILRQFDENLLNYVEYKNMDQNVFLDEMQEKIDFLYIDAADKPQVLSKCLNKLNEDAIVLVDDMTEPWIREACIDVVNKSEFLTPIERIDFYPQNGQEIKYQELLNSELPTNNFQKHKSGVQQYPAQLILRYSKKSK